MRNVRYMFSKLQIPPRSFTPINSIRFISNHMDCGGEILDDQPYKFEKCINEVKLLGRVGKEPAVSERNGKSFIEFFLATKRSGIDASQSQSDWHYIFTFNPLLVKSLSSFVKKGQRMYVSGKLSYINDTNTNKKITGVMLLYFICFS